MTLENKRFFAKQLFHLSEKSLKVYRSGIFDSSEFEVSLENIHNKKRIQTVTNNNFLFLFFALMLVGVIFLITLSIDFGIGLMILGAVFFILALTTRRRTVLIPTYEDYTIELFYKKSNKGSVLDFADKIIVNANRLLLRKYGTIDKALPIESQLNNLNFLVDRDIITIEEFQTLKDQLLGRNNKNTVGF